MLSTKHYLQFERLFAANLCIMVELTESSTPGMHCLVFGYNNGTQHLRASVTFTMQKSICHCTFYDDLVFYDLWPSPPCTMYCEMCN